MLCCEVMRESLNIAPHPGAWLFCILALRWKTGGYFIFKWTSLKTDTHSMDFPSQDFAKNNKNIMQPEDGQPKIQRITWNYYPCVKFQFSSPSISRSWAHQSTSSLHQFLFFSLQVLLEVSWTAPCSFVLRTPPLTSLFIAVLANNTSPGTRSSLPPQWRSKVLWSTSSFGGRPKLLQPKLVDVLTAPANGTYWSLKVFESYKASGFKPILDDIKSTVVKCKY